MNMETVFQGIGKLWGTGSRVGEPELSDWVMVFSEFLPTFDVLVHTCAVCCCWEENTCIEGGGGAQWE